jgi:hypothetical protein
MKNQMMIAIVLTSLAAGAYAQPPGGRKFELGLSGGYENYSTGSSGGSSSLFLISPRLGYFVYEGLEIEPELVAAFPSVGDVAYQVSGNLSYNFPLQGKALGFLLAGYGAGNTIPVFGFPGGSYQNTTITVLNLGGGLKILAADNVAIRLEGRYRKYSGTQEITVMYTYPAFSQKIDTRIFSILFGLSLFF